MTRAVDAVVIGSGPNGLVAANVLADRGWDVHVLEAQPKPGGAVRSVSREPGVTWDLFSSFYPFALVAPAMPQLGLERFGLHWSHAESPVAQVIGPGSDDVVRIERTPRQTAESLARFSAKDASTWLSLCEEWQSVKAPLLSILFSPFPPARGAVSLLHRFGVADGMRLARFLALPVQRMERELFESRAARLLLRGNALHADVPVTAPVSGMVGYVLTMLAQESGFPTPRGGAQQLTSALTRRLEAGGGYITCNARVQRILVQGGRATGVVTDTDETVYARRAIIADVSAPDLYESLLPRSVVPERVRQGIEKFQWDPPVVKSNYVIEGEIPWASPLAASAGTVHIGGGDDQDRLILFGQMTAADSTRSPAGLTSAWAYTKAPRGSTELEHREIAAAMTEKIDTYAPGFAERIVDVEVQTGSQLERDNENLRGGAVNSGTFELFQQYVFRPFPGLADNHTPVKGLYLGSASAHPGGGVHGMCGWNAAHSALKARGPRQRLRAAIARKLMQ
ncbi:phytoene desaturase family protein [Hoyosella subflava]|uniref:Pyridine nucleotide-disulfide oxidoreductase domain-containing protein 2 n=1 Tax=Hoyosella subflava (strain DSM 45089 / JCM 17490 / NBRC 109087 / DQS3-9A1) TaxID=443218 RepID=F6EH29_HOYSD|nr:NAD(P)/FAD-dependent oxidoreductase [Hoyosella subflava]AEF39866.1 Metal-dependent hydrolase family protein [Hoyosella subflava DQS3-9A1]